MAKWHSFDKQDWCYRGPGFVGTAFLMADQAYDDTLEHILVWGFTGKFTTAHLHQMLWLTKNQFSKAALWCEYRGELAAQLEELAALGLIVKEHIHLDRVLVHRINEPESNRPSIHPLLDRIWHCIVASVLDV